ncbi:C1 family peptidase [Edaphobacter modestus]|uniref:Papain like protease n=1 Tax=Edaphobacter modestus TaxID=388466 RepID=A0A4Q7YX51_9BACT|nr:C1 family peptidase [Edaphobacter modestus]RZU41781.1 hypothetical protein BDD14_3317 [Edaphobacter modestus]
MATKTKKQSVLSKKKSASKKTAKKATKKTAVRKWPKRNVVPDSIDLRDRAYQPSVMLIPAEVLAPSINIPVLNQRLTSACTGFALASVIFHLQHKAKREKVPQPVSSFMLYSMARRYDEFPGDPTKDTGSSLRGAMKGWYKYGACAARLWRTAAMPAPAANPDDDWWQDAVRRPLGAYYRVDTRSVTDMQVALNEIGVLYASAVCHTGWMEGLKPRLRGRPTIKPSDDYWVIPRKEATPEDGAHAFAIVGYTREGFIIQNSWDTNWGTGGRAVLTYQDWTENAMDCWVAQLGVTTDLHTEIASSATLRVKQGRVQLASDETLRNREIGPFIIDMENNGKLSNTGDFRTQDSDVMALLNQQLGEARKKWGLRDSQPVDVAIYAHGGLTSEDDAARTAAQWIPAMYDRQIFPVFLMWETDLFATLKNIWADIAAKQPRTTGAVMDRVRGWWNSRLERLLAVPGSSVWGQMKQNADAISSAQESGGLKLYEASKRSPYFKDMSKVRLHLVGHSAGAIVHSYIVNRLKWNFETVNFMAPAVRADVFQSQVVPAIRSGKVKQYNQFELTDEMEQKDPTCKPILDYSRSLLYLVSQSFEKGEVTPILGMERYFASEVLSLGLRNVATFKAPQQYSKSTTHGGFDNDTTTRDKILSLIKG